MENPAIQPSSQGYRVQSKSWFLTYPQCSLTKEQVRDLILAKGKATKGMVIARELHEDGHPHIHAYVLLDKEFNCRNPRFWDLGEYHGNYQSAKSIGAVVTYIKKDGDILEHGDIDWSEKIAAKQEHRRYLGKRLQNEPLHEVAKEFPELMFQYSALAKSISQFKLDNERPFEAPDVRGIWIYGPPRVGKSRYVRSREPSLYIKAQNKWWDGYIGEKAVLIDDMDSDCLAHYLKIWSDRYACTGEIKGGIIPLLHERFYVTSNFSIDELFSKNFPPVTIEAIKARFKIIHMTGQNCGLDGYRRSRSASPN